MRNWLLAVVMVSCVGAVRTAAQEPASAAVATQGQNQESAAADAAPVQVAVATQPKNGVRAPDGADRKIVEALDQFCKKWMGFLAKRELDNKAKVSWKEAGTGVEGQYVAYGTDYDCQLKHNGDPKVVPVALLKYIEYIHRRRGSSAEDAMLTVPDVLEATEVTEIFRYTKGQWVY